jgi:hypothetical protein
MQSSLVVPQPKPSSPHCEMPLFSVLDSVIMTIMVMITFKVYVSGAQIRCVSLHAFGHPFIIISRPKAVHIPRILYSPQKNWC